MNKVLEVTMVLDDKLITKDEVLLEDIFSNSQMGSLVDVYCRELANRIKDKLNEQKIS